MRQWNLSSTQLGILLGIISFIAVLIGVWITLELTDNMPLPRHNPPIGTEAPLGMVLPVSDAIPTMLPSPTVAAPTKSVWDRDPIIKI